jgi:hypothetical protein
MITNIKSLGLLRNGKVYQTKTLAQQALTQQNPTNDGVAKLARYLEPVLGGDPIIRTLVGFYANAAEMEDAGGGQSSYTILDIDGNAGDLAALEEAVRIINQKIGTGIEGTTLTIAINDINAKIGEGFDATNTVAKALLDLQAAMTVSVIKEQESGDYAAVYTIKQGDTVLNTINIPKDQFVKYAAVVKGTWDGDTFTPDPEGPDEAIEIVFQEVKDPIYINVKDLVNMYVGDKGIEIVGDKVSVKIDGNSEAFLTVSENGLKLDGVQKAIDDAIEAARLHESDGIKILANNKIKAHAASMIGDGIVNPIYVDAEGIKLNKELDMGYYDYQTVVNEIPSAADASTSNVVLTDTNTIATLTSDIKYNSLFVSNAKIPSSDIKLNAKNITVDNVVINGNKGTTNGKIIFNTPNMSIDNVEVESGSTAYNVFEGSQATADTANFVKNFNACNVTVGNTMLAHNVFNVYTVADNAVITIKDSYFNLDVDNSNVLRMANYGNATGVTINFENITWTYENAEKSDIKWAGLMIFQPASNDVASSGDTSKIATWTINVKDCVYNGVKVNANNFGKINQVVYLYNIGGTGAITDAANVMTINFN